MYSLYVLFIYINIVIVLRDVKPTKLASDCCGIHIGYFAENQGFFFKKQVSDAPKTGLVCQIYENLLRC